MKQLISILFLLLLSGCQIDPYTHAPTWTGTDWYDAGIQDAISGYAVKDMKLLPTTSMIPKSIVRNILRVTPKDNAKSASKILFTPEVWPGKPFLQVVIRSKILTSYTMPGKKEQTKVLPQ